MTRKRFDLSTICLKTHITSLEDSVHMRMHACVQMRVYMCVVSERVDIKKKEKTYGKESINIKKTQVL